MFNYQKNERRLFIMKNTTIKFSALFLLAAISFSYAFVQSENKRPAIVSDDYKSASKPDQPEELGAVHWLRDIDVAVAQSKEKNKPILILFQEVPGCSTCRNYGNSSLSHPLLVEAMESLFIPLAIHNNKGGEDAKVLKYFGEPAWNNPVVRIVNNSKKDLIRRVNGNYSKWGLADAMIRALDNTGTVAPRYLEFLAQELAAEKTGTKTATFGMYCFWSGEKEIGSLDGVTATKPGFMGGREVVQVNYNPDVISYDDLAEKAKNARCNSHIYTNDASEKAIAKKVVGESSISNESKFRLDKDVKYYLSKTHYRFVPMTEMQAARVNSQIGQGKSFTDYLSPRQIALAKKIKDNPERNWESAVNVEFTKAWENSYEL